jgi:hypothetical protein
MNLIRTTKIVFHSKLLNCPLFFDYNTSLCNKYEKIHTDKELFTGNT